MIFKSRFQTASILFLVIGQFTLAQAANALVPKQNESSLESLAFISETLQANPHSVDFDEVRDTDASGIASTWEGFRKGHGDWSAIVDRRTGKIAVAEGEGIPFVPGRGNQLRMEDISSKSIEGAEPGLTDLEAIARAFLPDVADMLGVDPATLVLNRGRSGHPGDYLWYIDFDVTLDGMPVEGARVVFRVNNGNLIQFGSENLPAEGTHTPKGRMTRNQALSVLDSYIGSFSAADSFIDGGSQLLIPVALPNSQSPDGFERGKGRGLTRVWQFIFRRDGDPGTWRARIDATTGKLLEFRDINDYVSAQVAGGVTSLSGIDLRPMPFADISSGGYTNSAGIYNYTSGTVSSTLNGQYVKINDSCGPISMTSDIFGNLSLGTSTGTDDCSTPGFGGAGNTNASRTQFYTINRAKEIARGWLNLPWLTSQLTTNVNLPDYNGDGICNAFWDGTKLNLHKQSTSCSNSGEIQGVGLHEFGHGLDANDGNGPSLDNGTGETYGDWTAALFTHDSCIGAGLLTANCDGYGEPCTSCTGVRDIDYAKHSYNTPHTVSNFTQVRCPIGNGSIGPCWRKGHCESYVSSEALWDLATRDLPNPGTPSAWAIMDRLWYLSRSTATAAFTCFRATSPWTSDGCGSGSFWKTMRAVDDDDGNLANGTPHSAALYAAFNRHGMACTSDVGSNISFPGCTPPAAPVLSLAAGNNQVNLSWSGSTGSYDIYRNEQGCNAGFVKIANDHTNSSFTDNYVANNFTYFYQVVAQPNGNEACSSAPSSCIEAGPCLPPTPPASLTATVTSANQIDLTWTDSPGATRYHIYRGTIPGWPYTQIGTRSGNTFADTGLSSCKTYYYVVRAAKNETCESGASAQVTATTSGDCRTLTVSNRDYHGVVYNTPVGKINCGSVCSDQYDYGRQVPIAASPGGRPNSGYGVTWSGACTMEPKCGNRDSCMVSMTQDRSVEVSFPWGYYKLIVNSIWSEFGNVVTITPPGLSCNLYEDYYPKDTYVTLTATHSEGSVFKGWSGACTGTGTCTVKMSQEQTVTAEFSTYKLTVWRDGTGAGTIASAPNGINCGGDCQEFFPKDTVVTLTATPAAGSVFSGWSWDCSGTDICTIPITKSHAVKATFSLTTHTLTVSREGTGNGTVTSSPTGINCGADCNETYNYNTLVTLTATPGAGSVFGGWSVCSGTSTCTVAMTQARSVVATFLEATHALTVSLAGAGSGTVTSSPAGINCPGDCSEVYDYNTMVTLTATPATGSTFTGWSGACTGTGSCVVTMTAARSVAATFTLQTFTLSTSLAGTGSGTVTSSPAGINCPGTCSKVYDYNTMVTLTATSATGSTFTGWSGSCTGTGSCVVTMTAARSVTATFTLQTFTLSTSLAGTGSGTVTSSPAGINCPGTCSKVYDYNTMVTLTATPATGSTFTSWSGSCTGTGSCVVTMNAARSVTATFTLQTFTLSTSLAGTGSGTVTSSPAGINCPGTCSKVYDYNTMVTLTATPATGSTFTGWSGSCTGTGSCVVTMTAARSVTATFSDNGRDFYTIAPCRVFDSRVTGTPLTSQVPLIINVAGTCGVPATAKAVSLNVTAISAPGDGFITLYPGDITLPNTWTVSFPASLNRANNALIPLAWNGNGTLAALAVITGGGSMDMTLDVNGYYE